MYLISIFVSTWFRVVSAISSVVIFRFYSSISITQSRLRRFFNYSYEGSKILILFYIFFSRILRWLLCWYCLISSSEDCENNILRITHVIILEYRLIKYYFFNQNLKFWIHPRSENCNFIINKLLGFRLIVFFLNNLQYNCNIIRAKVASSFYLLNIIINLKL